jgi:hypothetical protein
MTVRIFDLSGKEVFVSQLAAKNQESLLSITLKSGMYLMRIQQGSTLFTEKICIE